MDAVLGVDLQPLAWTVFKRMELIHTCKQIELTDWLTDWLTLCSTVSTSWETDNIWLRKVNLIHGAAFYFILIFIIIYYNINKYYNILVRMIMFQKNHKFYYIVKVKVKFSRYMPEQAPGDPEG